MESCPVNGCTNKEGMCIHKQMMLIAAVIIVLAVLAKIFGWY